MKKTLFAFALVLLAGCTTMKLDTLTYCSWDELAFFGYRVIINMDCSDPEQRAKREES